MMLLKSTVSLEIVNYRGDERGYLKTMKFDGGIKKGFVILT